MEAILLNAHTGNAGDGKVFVAAIQSATSIRSGESGPTALLGSASVDRGPRILGRA